MNSNWCPSGRILLLVVCLFASVGQSFATDDLVSRLQQNSRTVTSFQADFTQEKILAMFSRPVIFSGRLTIVRPDRLRWEFTQPTMSALIFDGDKGMRCDENGKSASFDLRSDPIMRVVAEQLWLWLGGDYDRLGEQYELIVPDDSSLLVKPRQPGLKEYVKQVTLHFDPDSLQPRQVEILEPGGDSTRITFSSYLLNGQFPPQLFTGCNTND